MKKTFYRCAVWLCCILPATYETGVAQTTLTSGDIAVIGYNVDEANGSQRWAFMTMVTIDANTTIIFTDYGYDGPNTNFRTTATNDGYMTWVTPSQILKGTVIYCTNTTVNGSTTGVTGRVGGTTGGFASLGDQLFVYQGTSGTASGATFIFGMNWGQSSTYVNNGLWQTTGAVTVDQLSYKPPGLASTAALALTSNTSTFQGTGSTGSANYGFDNMYYAGTTSGTKTALLTAITNPANWAGNDVTPWNISSGGVFPSNSFSVLPVTLLNFTAQVQTAESVQLKWTTAMEFNNDHFAIERSADGVRFNRIGTVQGMGDNNQPTEYTLTDHTPEPGTNYYRLSQTDKDGNEKILGLRTVTVQNISLRISPNPAVNTVDASFSTGTWREVRLSNSAGRLLKKEILTASDHRVRFEVYKYRPGTYYLAFIGNDGKTNTVRKVLKRE